MENKQENKVILVIVGGSGTGKTRVAKSLVDLGFIIFVTATTRPMRDGEVNHVSYHFLKRSEFNPDDFIEQNEYVGNLYGTPIAEVESKLKQGNRFVIVLEENGARKMKELYKDTVKVVFLTVSEEEMANRMRNRGDAEEDIKQRIQKARLDNEFAIPDIADLVVENLVLEDTINQIIGFQKKEAC